MIYLDNAATTLYKPQEVDAAILDALHTAGNPGRGAHEPTLHASRLVYAAREALAELFHAPDPACIAFTANATGALNTALCGLLGPGDHVITTVCEHNSVLRPLYRLRTQGGQLSFAGVDAKGRLQYEKWEELVRPNTRALVVTGASNVTGNCTDLAKAAAFAEPSPSTYRHWVWMCCASPGTRLYWGRRAPVGCMCVRVCRSRPL